MLTLVTSQVKFCVTNYIYENKNILFLKRTFPSSSLTYSNLNFLNPVPRLLEKCLCFLNILLRTLIVASQDKTLFWKDGLDNTCHYNIRIIVAIVVKSSVLNIHPDFRFLSLPRFLVNSIWLDLAFPLKSQTSTTVYSCRL